jgi:hypothetical protein
MKKQFKSTTHQLREESHWQGSPKTAMLIRGQIAERWGEQEAAKYHPDTNCFTFNTWLAKGYKVKKGEKALRSYTIISKPAAEDQEEEMIRYPKGVCLFYILQVEKCQEAE